VIQQSMSLLSPAEGNSLVPEQVCVWKEVQLQQRFSTPAGEGAACKTVHAFVKSFEITSHLPSRCASGRRCSSSSLDVSLSLTHTRTHTLSLPPAEGNSSLPEQVCVWKEVQLQQWTKIYEYAEHHSSVTSKPQTLNFPSFPAPLVD